MFRKDYILKSEKIIINNGDYKPVTATLAFGNDDSELYVVVSNMNYIGDMWYWLFNIKENLSRYFDVKDIIEAAIDKSKNIDEFLEMLDIAFMECYPDELISSTWIDNYNECEEECRKCKENDSCEEYLSHKN